MAEIDKIKQQPNIEQVLQFLGDNRAKAFTLDIETDFTIVADEQAEEGRAHRVRRRCWAACCRN